jgi:hypothetical protein
MFLRNIRELIPYYTAFYPGIPSLFIVTAVRTLQQTEECATHTMASEVISCSGVYFVREQPEQGINAVSSSPEGDLRKCFLLMDERFIAQSNCY